MSKIIAFPAILNRVASRADRSWSLTFVTRELSGEDSSALMDQLMSEGHVLYSPNSDFKEADVPNEKANSGLGTKTQSQRLRGVIFRIWDMKGRTGDFEDYYRKVMESVIDQFKQELEDVQS